MTRVRLSAPMIFLDTLWSLHRKLRISRIIKFSLYIVHDDKRSEYSRIIEFFLHILLSRKDNN